MWVHIIDIKSGIPMANGHLIPTSAIMNHNSGSY